MDELDLGRFPEASADSRPFFETWEREKSTNDLRKRIEEILGPLEDTAFAQLREQAEQDFEGAINAYLDSSSKPASNSKDSQDPESLHTCLDNSNDTKSAGITKDAQHQKDIESSERDDQQKDIPSQKSLEQNEYLEDAKDSIPIEGRILGSFQAEVWSTRTGSGVIKFGETLSFQRSKAKKFTNFKARTKDDTIVRVCNCNGLDFARVSENDARFMAVLMDTRLCRFSATCIYADEYLSLGSIIVIQVDCFLLPTAFGGIMMPELEEPAKHESKEQANEKIMRLRQVGIVQLFGRLGLTEIQEMPASLEDAGNGDQDEEGHDLAKDQLDLIYRTVGGGTQQPVTDLGEAEPAPTFSMTLFPYQKRGLAWMLHREAAGASSQETKTNLNVLHPLWREFQFPDQGPSFYANLQSGELSLNRPTLESHAQGGILADEMGLGKTISVLSLIHTGDETTTLIVVPMSLLSQWESEVTQASKPGTCRCLVYYGLSTNSLGSFLHQSGRKVILTSYGVLTSEHKSWVARQQSNASGNKQSVFKEQNDVTGTGLFGVKFGRIVLDEAHTIKNRTTKVARASSDLQTRKRWALTGTPIVNRLEDLYSLVRFLHVEPWNNFAFWQAFVTRPFENPETREQAMETVQSLLAPICLRRTKSMTEPNGEPLVQLPERVVEIRRIGFSPEEQDLYKFVYNRVKLSVEGRIDDGTAQKSYTTILALIMRLRQICDHPLLLRSARKRDAEEAASETEAEVDLTGKDLNELLDKCTSGEGDSAANSVLPEYTTEVIRSIQSENNDNECPICSSEYEERAFTDCLHSACLDCLLCHINYLRRRGDQPLCHICRKPISTRNIMVLRNGRFQRYASGPGGGRSAKVQALIQALRGVPKGGKSVVFSQFVQFLEILEKDLAQAGIRTVRFDGAMAQQKRAEVLDEFRTYPDSMVLLLSLKAGGVGLNLVCAQRAFIMDPWWSWAIESQAIDRIHRFGQREQVHVVRFIVGGTIEERMLKIQDRKRALSSVVTDEQRRDGELDDIRLLFDLDKASIDCLEQS